MYATQTSRSAGVSSARAQRSGEEGGRTRVAEIVGVPGKSHQSLHTLLSPMDSNLYSAGTLEFRDVPLHFSLVSELTTSSGQSPFH